MISDNILTIVYTLLIVGGVAYLFFDVIDGVEPKWLFGVIMVVSVLSALVILLVVKGGV